MGQYYFTYRRVRGIGVVSHCLLPGCYHYTSSASNGQTVSGEFCMVLPHHFSEFTEMEYRWGWFTAARIAEKDTTYYIYTCVYIYIYVYIHVDILVCTAVVNIVAISSKYVYPYLYSIFNIHARYLPLSMSKGFALPWCYFTFWLSALRPHGRSLFQSLPVSAWVGGAARGCSIEMIEIRENVDEMNLDDLFHVWLKFQGGTCKAGF